MKRKRRKLSASKRNLLIDKKLTLRHRPFTLKFKYPFAIASGRRTTTDVVFVAIDYDGLTGYGEAAMPPYVNENQETVIAFLTKLNLARFNDPLDINDIIHYCDRVAVGNHAAKAAVDIALHDLMGKLLQKPLYELWNIDPEQTPCTGFTIGIDTREVVDKKVKEAKDIKIFKVKLGSSNDRQIIETVRSFTNKPLMIDANQGWKDKQLALEMILYLAEQNTLFVEQPFPVAWLEETAWLRERSPLPIIADEAVQRFVDIQGIKGSYDGINIKLMKSTGLFEARKMIACAREQGLKILLGCMSESSCGATAAAHLSPLADWVDLDGPALISNDPFTGMKIMDGRIVLNKLPGTGVSCKQEGFI